MDRNLCVWWNSKDPLPYSLKDISGKIWFLCPNCKCGELISEREINKMEDQMDYNGVTFYPVFCRTNRCKKHDVLRLPVPRPLYS